MSQDDDDDVDISKMTLAEQEALLLENTDKMSADEYVAFCDLAKWLAYERPKNSEPLTHEMVSEKFAGILRETTRRRLGGKVGVILPFKKPGTGE